MQSQSPTPDPVLSDADPHTVLDEDQQGGPSGVSGTNMSQPLIVPTTPTTTRATTTVLPPATTTYVASTSTVTTASCDTQPTTVVSNTSTQSQQARGSVRAQRGTTTQVRDRRAGGRTPVAETHQDNDPEDLTTIARVLGAYQQNQGVMGQPAKEIDEIRLMQQSVDRRMGQCVDLVASKWMS